MAPLSQSIRSLSQKVSYLILLFSVSVLLNGCGEFAEFLTGQDLNCADQSFTQVDQRTSKLDLILVVDSSGSMRNDLETLYQRINVFFEALADKIGAIDFRVAVMMAHIDGKWQGVPYVSANDEPAVLGGTTGVPLGNEFYTHMKYKLTDLPNIGQASEAGLGSTYRAIKDHLQKNQEAGILRPEAGLAVVYFADENESCLGPATVPSEVALLASGLCPSYTPQSVFQDLKTLKGDRPLFIGAAAHLDPTHRNFGNGYVGPGGITEAAFPNSVETRITADGTQLAADLSLLGDAVGQSFSLQTKFPVPAEASSVISVRVNGTPVAFNWAPGETIVSIEEKDAGKGGDQIVVRTCAANENPE